MKTYIHDDNYGNHDVYEIVEKIPKHFVLWNIGENMGSNSLIPFTTRMSDNKQDNEYYYINRNNLKAIELPRNEVKILREASSYGVENLEICRKIIKSKKEPKSYFKKQQLEYAKQSIEIFERITL